MSKNHKLIMGKMVSPLFSAVYGPTLFILSGNEDMHKSLDEFDFWSDLMTDYGVRCPCASIEAMSTLFLDSC